MRGRIATGLLICLLSVSSSAFAEAARAAGQREKDDGWRAPRFIRQIIRHFTPRALGDYLSPPNPAPAPPPSPNP